MLHSVTTDKLASLSFHIYFDSSVLFLYLGCLKSLLWLPKRSFFKGCFFHHSFFFPIMKNWALCWNFNKPSLVVYIKIYIYIYIHLLPLYIYIYIYIRWNTESTNTFAQRLLQDRKIYKLLGCLFVFWWYVQNLKFGVIYSIHGLRQLYIYNGEYCNWQSWYINTVI